MKQKDRHMHVSEDTFAFLWFGQGTEEQWIWWRIDFNFMNVLCGGYYDEYYICSSVVWDLCYFLGFVIGCDCLLIF